MYIAGRRESRRVVAPAYQEQQESSATLWMLATEKLSKAISNHFYRKELQLQPVLMLKQIPLLLILLLVLVQVQSVCVSFAKNCGSSHKHVFLVTALQQPTDGESMFPTTIFWLTQSNSRSVPASRPMPSAVLSN